MSPSNFCVEQSEKSRTTFERSFVDCAVTPVSPLNVALTSSGQEEPAPSGFRTDENTMGLPVSPAGKMTRSCALGAVAVSVTVLASVGGAASSFPAASSHRLFTSTVS